MGATTSGQVCGPSGQVSVPSVKASAAEEVECCPITIVNTSLTIPLLRATEGRKYCVLCTKEKKRNKTIWKCESCNVALCITADRNCYKEWHKKKREPGQAAP
ncbi:hypothetical protein JZ751_005682 [Albula glossodonta]|uniref:PiggyBac transposable element-derived protein 4 C-terminal zinc-ribbon domain-containing protein n=1 Tax=Albula glossodonta TaxID=121402 RepID=A0A8T2N3W6_9TELE|nr:hypothetical protein JZ751_005682 [Albula glossodonta]